MEFQEILREARKTVPLGATLHEVRSSFKETMDEEFPNWRRRKQVAIRALRMLSIAAVSIALAFLARAWVQRKADEQQRAVRGRVIDLIDPLEPVREEQITFAWRPSPISSYYRVELLDSEYHRIWSNALTREVEVELPREVRAKLTAGETYYWQVMGFDSAFHEVSRSPIQEMEVLR